MHFTQGQIISASLLNNIDAIIQNIKKDPTNQTYINHLIDAWEEIPASTDETNISDNIARILELQQNYIG